MLLRKFAVRDDGLRPTKFRVVAQRVKLGFRCQGFQVAHPIEQGSIRKLGMPFTACSEHCDLLVFAANRLGEPEHAQVREMFA